MSIHVAWYNQQRRILLLTFPPSWNWDTFGVAYREVLEMTCHINQPVDVIIDMRYVDRLPAHALNHAVRLAAHWDEHFGQMVFVTDQPTLLPFGMAARNIIPLARRQAHHTSTVAGAAALLEAQTPRAQQVHYA